jgi:hypothetical protein
MPSTMVRLKCIWGVPPVTGVLDGEARLIDMGMAPVGEKADSARIAVAGSSGIRFHPSEGDHSLGSSRSKPFDAAAWFGGEIVLPPGRYHFEAWPRSDSTVSILRVGGFTRADIHEIFNERMAEFFTDTPCPSCMQRPQYFISFAIWLQGTGNVIVMLEKMGSDGRFQQSTPLEVKLSDSGEGPRAGCRKPIVRK